MAVLPHHPLRECSRAAALPLCACLCLALCGCAMVLGLEPLAISNWHPRDSRLAAGDVGEIWVQFSADADHPRAEEAFSLSENSRPMTGSFSWSGHRLAFTPTRPLQDGNDYEMAVLASAETTEGNSLQKDFRFAFTTRKESVRPTVCSVQPTDGSRVSGPLQAVVLTFSEPVDRASFLAAWSVSPDPGGSISFSPKGAVATFTPLAGWQPGTEYRITVSDALTDLCGNHLASALRTRFTAGADTIRPHLSAVYAVLNGTPSPTPMDPGSATTPGTGFEATMGLQIVFDKDVQRQDIESFIDIEPAWGFQIDPAGAPRATFLLAPTERFAWGTLYRLTIRGGVRDESGNATAADSTWFFRVDGAATRPPSIGCVLFNGDPTPLAPFGNLDLSAFAAGVDAVAWFDVYVDLASGASIDPFSLMHSFTVTATNGAAILTPLAVAVGAFADPQPAPQPGLTPARVSVKICNTTNSGMVTLGVSEGW